MCLQGVVLFGCRFSGFLHCPAVLTPPLFGIFSSLFRVIIETKVLIFFLPIALLFYCRCFIVAVFAGSQQYSGESGDAHERFGGCKGRKEGVRTHTMTVFMIKMFQWIKKDLDTIGRSLNRCVVSMFP